ncbi:MAG: hypothetical protein AAF663_01820 [Planctomycetota bacterium]
MGLRKLLKFNRSFQYEEPDEALPFLVAYLGFCLVHDEGPGKLRVAERDSVCVTRETNAEYAARLR